MAIRVWVSTLAALAGLLLTGCRTAPPGPPVFELTRDEARFGEALAHFAQGLIYEEELGGDAPDTIAMFEQAATFDPGRHRIQSKIALGYLLRREPDKAVAALAASVERHPNDLTIRTDMAATCQFAGRLDEAAKHFEAALEIDPGYDYSYLSLARIHAFRQNDAAALSAIRRGLAEGRDPEPLAEFAKVRGRELITKEELARALPYFEALIESGRVGRRELLNLIGQIRLELDQPEEAADVFLAATREPDPLPDSFVKLGNTLLHLRKTDEALAALTRGQSLHPDDPALLFRLAVAYSIVSDHDAALEVFAHIEASVHLEEGQRMTRDFYLNYGSTCERAGRLLKAEALLSSCIQIYPDAHEALNYLAYMWADQNVNLDEAMSYVRRALEEEPDNGAYADTLGWLLYRQGDYDQAREMIERADTLVPNDPIINDHLGDIHDAMGDRQEAVRYWTRSLQLDPHNHITTIKLKAYGANPKQILHAIRK